MHSSIAIPGKDIVFTDFDGEGMIVDLNTKQYFKLNETAALIWRNLEKGRTVEEIVLDLCRDRGLTLGTAESCTGGLVSMPYSGCGER